MYVLERRWMKISYGKAENVCEWKGDGTLRLQWVEMEKVHKFKYLRSTVQNNGDCGKEV